MYEKCPAIGGKAVSANLDEIRKLPNVVDAFIVEENGGVTKVASGVAIVANNPYGALTAKKKLKVVWDETNASKDSWTALTAFAKSEAAKGAGPQELKKVGDVDAFFAGRSDRGLILGFVAQQPGLEHTPGTRGPWGQVEIGRFAIPKVPARAVGVVGLHHPMPRCTRAYRRRFCRRSPEYALGCTYSKQVRFLKSVPEDYMTTLHRAAASTREAARDRAAAVGPHSSRSRRLVQRGPAQPPAECRVHLLCQDSSGSAELSRTILHADQTRAALARTGRRALGVCRS